MNETYQIGKPFEPSQITNFKTENAYGIHMSFGGGMGGGSSRIYTYNKPDTTKNIIEIIDVFGITKLINLNYVVSIYPVQLIIVDVLNKGNTCLGNPGETKRYIYAIHPSDKAIKVEKFIETPKDLLIITPFNIKGESL